MILAFLRISTRPVFPSPLSADQAGEVMDAWLAQPNAVVVEPTSRHLSTMRSMLSVAGTAGNLVSDAHLAALAIEHNADVVTFDADYARFEVSVIRPR